MTYTSDSSKVNYSPDWIAAADPLAAIRNSIKIRRCGPTNAPTPRPSPNKFSNGHYKCYAISVVGSPFK